MVVVPSEDEEDSAERQVFKRRRTTPAAPHTATSTSSSSHGTESFREHFPSATPPTQPMALEGGVKTEAAQPASAPELPLPIQETLRGYLEKMSSSSQTEGPKKEGMNHYMGAFIVCANTWRAQAKTKVVEASTLQALEKENALLKEEKETLARRWGCQEEAYKDSLREAQKSKDAISKRLHEVGQTYAELLGQVVPLCVEIADLKDVAQVSEVRTKKLDDQCVDREQKLGKTEAVLSKTKTALEAKTKECELLEAKVKDLEKVETELRAALVNTSAIRSEELALQAENFKATEEKLVQEAATAFADGFAEDLTQATCVNPGINVSECNLFNEVVDGRIVPLEAPEE